MDETCLGLDRPVRRDRRRRDDERLLLDVAPASTDGDAVPGILKDPFVPTVTADTLDGTIRQIRAHLIATGVQPNFAAANAVTIQTEESLVGTDGHPIGALSDDGRIRRLPLIASEALDDGQVLVGDSRVGARLGSARASASSPDRSRMTSHGTA